MEVAVQGARACTMREFGNMGVPRLQMTGRLGLRGEQIITFAMSAHRHNCALQVKACRALRNFADNVAANQTRIAGLPLSVRACLQRLHVSAARRGGALAGAKRMSQCRKGRYGAQSATD